MGVIYKNGILYGGGGTGGGSSGGGGSSDYEGQINKPSINGVTLVKGLSTDDLGLIDNDTLYMDNNDKIAVRITSASDIESLFS